MVTQLASLLYKRMHWAITFAAMSVRTWLLHWGKSDQHILNMLSPRKPPADDAATVPAGGGASLLAVWEQLQAGQPLAAARVLRAWVLLDKSRAVAVAPATLLLVLFLSRWAAAL